MDVKVDYLADAEVGATAPCSSPPPSRQCLTSSRRLQVNHDKKQVIFIFLLPQKIGHSVSNFLSFHTSEVEKVIVADTKVVEKTCTLKKVSA